MPKSRHRLERGRRSALRAVVERDDATGEVRPAHLLPAGRLDDARQLALRRPGADRLGEIDVRVRVAGRATGDRWKGAHQVVGVDGAEDLVDRLAELADEQAATGPGDPQELPQGRCRVSD